MASTIDLTVHSLFSSFNFLFSKLSEKKFENAVKSVSYSIACTEQPLWILFLAYSFLDSYI